MSRDTRPTSPAIDRFEHSAVAQQLLRYRMLDFDPATGVTRSAMTAGPDTINGVGNVLGGILTAMLDMGLTAAALNLLTVSASVPTLEIKTSFLAPAPAGDYVCEAWATRMGRTIGFLEARLKAADGKVVATGSTTVLVVPDGSR